MNPSFVHLNVRSRYSLVDGMDRIDSLVDAAAAAGMPAMAVTDIQTTHGLVDLFQAADAQGIHPILGAELLLPQISDPAANRLILLVESATGYRNLNRWLSWSGNALGWPSGWKPAPDAPAWLACDTGKQNEASSAGDTDGLIALVGPRSPIGAAVRRSDHDTADGLLGDWSSRFPGRLYLELNRTGRAGEEEWIAWCRTQASRLGLPVVATNAVRFLAEEDAVLHQARLSLAERSTLADLARVETISPEQFLRSPAEMAERFADLPAALANTLSIAARCRFALPVESHPFPALGLAQTGTTANWLATEARCGLDATLSAAGIADAESRTLYVERLEEELEVIERRGFTECFAILTDLVRWCATQGIPVGPGRGRMPASLVAFALGITQVDPVAHALPFACFLTRSERNPPWIGLDLGEGTRAELLGYLRERYGAPQVGELSKVDTLGRFRAIERLSPILHRRLTREEIDRLLEQEQNARNAQEQALLATAERLAGVAVGVSAHAGDVLIAPRPLVEMAPIDSQGADGCVLSHLTPNSAKALGLLPLGLLRYRPLSVIDGVVRRIDDQRETPAEPALDITRIPLDDPAVFGLLEPGRSRPGQAWPRESVVGTSLAELIRPATFEHLVALRALFRQGPLEAKLHEAYAARRHGQVAVTYAHPRLLPILGPTYAMLLYSEQIIQVAEDLAGFSGEEAFTLYREWQSADSKRRARQRDVLTQGLTRQGIDAASAGAIADQIDQFINGACLRAHAVAYTLIDYRNLWLFAHYPGVYTRVLAEFEIRRRE